MRVQKGVVFVLSYFVSGSNQTLRLIIAGCLERKDGWSCILTRQTPKTLTLSERRLTYVKLSASWALTKGTRQQDGTQTNPFPFHCRRDSFQRNPHPRQWEVPLHVLKPHSSRARRSWLVEYDKLQPTGSERFHLEGLRHILLCFHAQFPLICISELLYTVRPLSLWR